MGICGSAGKKDEVWHRGSFSARSFSGENSNDLENGETSDNSDFDPEEERRRFEQAGAMRKRLTLKGDLMMVGCWQTQYRRALTSYYGKQPFQKRLPCSVFNHPSSSSFSEDTVGTIDMTRTFEEEERAACEVERVETPAPENLPDCHYVALSKKGYVPYDEKVNQDAVLCIELLRHKIPGLDMHFFGVLDGHGLRGRDVSQNVIQTFPQFLEKNLSQFTRLEELTDNAVCRMLEKTIDQVEKEIHTTKINLLHSGTTFCGSLIFDNTIYTVNVGDSQAMMITQETGKDYKIHDLNQLHSPDVPSEKRRIQNAGGVVLQLPGLPAEEAGPFRVWLPDMSGPGLAMSRSIGDSVAHSVGCTHMPEITIKKIDSTCKYVLWASDGVFEFLKTKDVAQHLMKPSSLQEKAKAIVKNSVKLWRRYDTVVDDISVVILQLPEE